MIQHLYSELIRAINFWVQTTIEDYIVKFAVENYKSFSKVNPVFRSRLRGIKMLMVEEVLLPLPGGTMVA